MLPTASITSASPRAEIMNAYHELSADCGLAFAAFEEARAEFRAVPFGADTSAAEMVLELTRTLRAYLSAEFDRLYSIVFDLPEIEEPAETDAADQFALAL